MRATLAMCALAAVACGSSSPPPEAPSPRDQRFAGKSWSDILPARPDGVAVIDVAAIASSDLFSTRALSNGLFEPVSWFTTAADRCGIGTEQVGRLVFAQYGDEGFVALLLGTIEEDLAARCVDELLTQRGSRMQTTKVAETRAYHSANERDRLWMAVPVAGVMVISSNRAMLRRILDPAEPRSADAAELVEQRAKTLGTGHTAWIVWRLERGGRAPELLAAIGLDRILKDMSELFASVDLGSSLELSLGLGFPDAAQAKAAHASLEQTQQLWRPPPKFAALVEGIRIALSGRDVTISVSASKQQLDALFGPVTGSRQTPDGP